MSKYVQNENSFYNGISQQNPELRLDTQVEDAVNTKLSVASGVEKRPSASLLLEEADAFAINCKGHELELNEDNQFIMVFNSDTANKPHTAYSTKGTIHKIIAQDGAVDAYIETASGTFNPDKDLRLTTVLDTTIITNKNVVVEMEAGVGSGLSTAKYLYFNNGVQQVTRKVAVDVHIWDSAKKTNNDTEVLVDDFMTFLGSTAGYTGTRIGDSVVKVTKDDGGAFNMSATDSYSDTTMKIAPVAGAELEALPPKALNDEIIKIIAEDSSDASYYLQYDATSASWFETVLPGTETDFNETTMPHKIEFLQDTDGSVTGTIGEFYFYVSPITWAPRTTGDVDNSPNPSFVGKTVNDIFFFKNRLGLVSTDTVICSAVDDIYNFWPKTVKEVLDDDPVDLSIATTRNVTLEYAEVFPDSMAIIGNNTQYSLHSDGKPFTNANATMDVTTSYEVSPLVKPKSVGSSLYMVVPRDSYSAVREYAVIPDTLVTDAVDITGHVPRLIPESVKQIATDNSLGHVFLLDKELSDGKYTLWNYSFYWQGNEKVQSAWSKWDFWFQPKAMGVFNSALYIVGSEATETGMKTIMVKLRLETNTIEVLNYLNPEPLVDRLQLFPDSAITPVDSTSTLLEVDQELYDSVDYIDPADLVLVDRLSGASGSYVLRYEQGGRYFLQFDFNVISKFNFFLNDNSTLVGAHKIGGIS